MLSVILLLVAPWSVYGTSPIPPPCTCLDGTKVPVGEEVWSTPCRGCYCDENTFTAVPLMIMCDAITPCVDSIHEPDQCCPSCPNGANCRANFVDDNGKERSEVILASDGLVDFGSTTCHCDNSHIYHGGEPKAYCQKPEAVNKSPVIQLKLKDE